ncbi:hypothetical protein [Tunturiibacter gelidoferens]|jgi:hypothetical protein|uniref:Uncharacterized protein n=1 Tax=Tunturiibacter gelidiferens TaxID=3069689 RepID=A0A9X0U3N2_9BACT|nr:hypothetical protein [Edaphobacter lichenicola]MBB5328539.1 hypothetical protein [Edaphobacter lichenicola]
MKKILLFIASLLFVAHIYAQATTYTDTIKAPSRNVVTSRQSNVLEASLFPGSDIGAQVNNAIHALPVPCGKITVAPGNYSLSTKIQKPRCVVLDFNGSTLTSTITSGASISTGSNFGTDTTIYAWGSIKNLKLYGPGLIAGTVGIWLGGDRNGVYAPTGNNDFLDSYENINIENFESGMDAGVAFQDAFYSDSLSANKYGYKVDGQFGGENMNMFGMQILNNGTYGFYAPNMPASEYVCMSCSIDYNGTGQSGQAGIYILNGRLTLLGGHMEQCGGYFIDGPTSTTVQQQLSISGMTFVASGKSTPSESGCPAFTAADPAYIHVTGYNSGINIGQGVEIIRNHTYTSFINWQATGAANELHVEPYSDPLTPTGVGLQTIGPGQNTAIGGLQIPIYAQYISTSQYFSSITVGSAVGGAFPATGDIFASGLLGTNINTGGRVPGTSAFPFSGGYMGFNSANNGDVDFYSPYSNPATSGEAYDFFLNYRTSFSKILSIDRSGSITANGAIFQKGSIQIGVPGAASTVFSFATAPSGRCTAGDIGMNRAGIPNSLYICQAGTWVGK